MSFSTGLDESKNPLNSFLMEQIHKVHFPPGGIIMWNGSTAPDGWGLCNGNTYSRIDGTGTITSPDLRGRFILSSGNGTGLTSRTVGDKGGTETHTLTTNEIPSHTHTGTTVSNGSHNHTGSTSTTGAHTHTGTTESSGTHDHTSNAVGGQGNYGLALANGANTAVETDTSNGELNVWTTPGALDIYNNGAHTHTFTSDSNGNHAHTITSDGSHTHTFTSDATGGGQAHNNMPPYYVLAYIIKL